MLARERAELLRIRDAGHGRPDECLRRVMNALDVEESILDRMSEDETTADRETDLRPPYDRPARASTCRGLRLPTPVTPTGCEECLREGTEWVHLRLCMTAVTSAAATRRRARTRTSTSHETGHPVMRSFEPGEAWRWCFVDEVIG